MSQEHAELEADWLAAELKRAGDYARKAYEATEEGNRRLYLANLIGSLDSLYAHYQVPAADELGEAPLYPPAPRPKKERGPMMRFFLGDAR